MGCFSDTFCVFLCSFVCFLVVLWGSVWWCAAFPQGVRGYAVLCGVLMSVRACGRAFALCGGLFFVLLMFGRGCARVPECAGHWFAVRPAVFCGSPLTSGLRGSGGVNVRLVRVYR